MNNKLHHIILSKQWQQLIDEHTPQSAAQCLSFEEAMSVAYDMFFENFLDSPKIRDFALNLFFAIRKHYIQNWDKDWKNDIFLADLCRIGYKYDECYHCCMRAYKKFNDPPSAILLALAGCYNVPKPLVSIDEVELWLQQAIQKELSYEAALQLKGIYLDKEDQAQIDHWTKIADEAERNNIHTASCTPDIFKDKPTG